MRVVIDTNVLVSALKSQRGAAFALISLLPSEHFQPALSVPLYAEYQDVLTRPEHLIENLSTKDIQRFLRYICKISHRQNIFFLWRPRLKDPKDEMVLELAAASQSRYIITYNLRDFKGVERFGIKALTPAAFLKKIRRA